MFLFSINQCFSDSFVLFCFGNNQNHTSHLDVSSHNVECLIGGFGFKIMKRHSCGLKEKKSGKNRRSIFPLLKCFVCLFVFD